MEENTEQIEDMFLFIYEGKTAEIFLHNRITYLLIFPMIIVVIIQGIWNIKYLVWQIQVQ